MRSYNLRFAICLRDSLRELFQDIPQLFKTPLKNLLKSSILVMLQPAPIVKPATQVKNEFLGISRRATFWNITIYMIEFTKIFAEKFFVTLLNGDSTTTA